MIKRPLVIITLCYIISIIWGIYLKKYIPFLYAFGVIANIYSYYLFNYKKYSKFSKYNLYFFNICILLIIISTTFIKNKDNSFNNFVLNDTNIYVKIEEIESDSEYYSNYIARNIKDNKKIYLKIKINKSSTKYRYGDLVKVTGNFEKAEGRRNYKGFSYFDYLKTKNIYGIFKADKSKFIKNDSTNVYKMWINRLRERLKSNIYELTSKENSGIALALLLGDSSKISDVQKNTFSNANLSHVLAISGMHVSYVIMGLSFVLKKISIRTGKFIFIVLLIIFTSLTGASPSVVRAVLMSVFTLVASLIYRKSDTINNIAISALIILINNPYSLFNLGFQLSFLGTLGIVLFHSKIENKMINWCSTLKCTSIQKLSKYKKFQNIIKIISVSISANILIFPIVIYNFNSISLIFVISNLLVTPILGILIFSGYIMTLTSIVNISIAAIPAVIFNKCIEAFVKTAEFSESIKFLRTTVGTPGIFEIVLIYVFIGILGFYKKAFKKFLIVYLIISTLFRICVFYNNDFNIHFVDVGQGDCTLIITLTNKTVLIDGGGSESDDYDVGKSVLVPYLLDRRITCIDYVIFSHFDSDHCKGLFSVMKDLKVKAAIVSEQSKVSDNYKYFLELAKEKCVKVIKIKAGDFLKIDKYSYLEILWPSKNQISQNPLNNNSIVFKFIYKNKSILFTGDIEEEAERELEKIYGNKLKADILKTAHHGSKTSSREEFLMYVKPQIALIGVGKNNKFGHPNDEVIERFKKLRNRSI